MNTKLSITEAVLGLLLLLSVLTTGCGSDDTSGPNGPETPVKADVNTYMQSLPAWDVFSPPVTFDDDEFSGAPSNIISIGDVGNCEDDDFEIVVSDFRSEGKVEVFNGDQKIAEFTLSNATDFFMGVVSSVPITRLRFNEDAGGNDIYIRDFTFGVAYRR